MKFVYHGDPVKIGIVGPVLDRHDRALVPAQIVRHDDPAATRKIESGKAFDVDEIKEPALAGFLRIDKRFTRPDK